MVGGIKLAAALRQRIEQEYLARGDGLGWRLLYSPDSVLDGACVAFLGLNPGGNHKPRGHAEFSMPSGSAYLEERWDNHSAGNSPLQRQVLKLFKTVGEAPENVLAGNLVPFRSPTWSSLKAKPQALEFGKEIWRSIFNYANPDIVIGMGEVAKTALIDLLRVRDVEAIPLEWGNICAVRGRFDQGVFIGVPHLSRYRIMYRSQSMSALQRLFLHL